MGTWSRMLAGWRIAGTVLALCVLAALGVAYSLFVVRQQQYLIGRNFRLLSNLDTQIENTLDAEARTLAALVEGDQDAPRLRTADDIRRAWGQIHQRRYREADIVVHRADPVANPVVSYRFDPTPRVLRLAVTLRPDAGEANPPGKPAPSTGAATPPTTPTATIALTPLLDPLFGSRVRQGAFDTVVVAQENGEVIYGFGQHAHDLAAGGLGALVAGSADGSFAPRARSTAITDVVVEGVKYKLFTQPCCTTTDPAARWVLGGLVPAEQFRSSSWAISTTVVKLALFALIVVMVAWPFLRLTLLGDRQRVRVTDVVHLLASAVGGLAIVTMGALDWIGYRALMRDVDTQLERLATAIDQHVTRELRDAHDELQCARNSLPQLAGPVTDHTRLSAVSVLTMPLTCASDAGTPRAFGSRYPFFDSIAFIDQDGYQRVKLWTDGFLTSRLKVDTRGYVQDHRQGRAWTDTAICGADACAFESLWAWTTGEPLGVLSVGSADRLTELPVAAISIPMRSVVRPVLPPGFEFAVIDGSGDVLFHSDPLRNKTENFFAETDGNRRLRAEVAAHSAEALNLRYWGAPYRAFIRPMRLPNTYVVALAQASRTWAINREWLIVAMIFFGVQFVVWVVVATITIVPRAPWLWPDPRRGRAYAELSAVGVIFVAVAVAALLAGNRDWLLAGGLALPLAGWLVAYWRLRRAPPDAPSTTPDDAWTDRRPVTWWTRSGYPVAAVFVLLVTGVVPGALLLHASYTLHAQSYTRNAQLGMARALEARWQRIDERFGEISIGSARTLARVAARAECVDDVDVYLEFASDTHAQTTSRANGAPAAGSSLTRRCARPMSLPPASSGPHDWLLSLLEDHLPYYSDASVEWRELLHQRANDDSWGSDLGESGAMTMRVAATGLALTTFVPSMTRALTVPADEAAARRTTPAPEVVGTVGLLRAAAGDVMPRPSPVILAGRAIDWRTVLLLAIAAVAIVALTRGIVQVFLRQVFLVDVEPPLWTSMALAVSSGDNVFVICDETSRRAQLDGFHPLRLGPLVRRRNGQMAWRREMRDLDRRNLSGSPVIIDDLDDGLDDIAQTAAKLQLLDALVADPFRTVVVVSFASPAAVSDALRTAGSGAGGAAFTLWTRMLTRFTVLDRRHAPQSDEVDAQGPAGGLLRAERASHPYVARICDDIARSPAFRQGLLTRRQVADEIVERAAPLYRRIWQSCSEDEQVVLNHVAQHGLALASVRGVVRRLLGRGLLRKDPALRTMSDTFCQFVLSKECAVRVSALETAGGRSAWDRLRAPLALAVVVLGVFLFVTQKELYNAILGVTTAAAVSVPALIRTVGQLAGRREEAVADKA